MANAKAIKKSKRALEYDIVGTTKTKVKMYRRRRSFMLGEKLIIELLRRIFGEVIELAGCSVDQLAGSRGIIYFFFGVFE
ncbi:MAG: hypothetical protein ACTHLX_21300 [Candidatus Binatia bacterium]